MEEFAINPMERPRAWTVAFLSGLTQPWMFGRKLLLPKDDESRGGDEKVAFFCCRERERGKLFAQVSAKGAENGE